jgi:hypothetical protein
VLCPESSFTVGRWPEVVSRVRAEVNQTQRPLPGVFIDNRPSMFVESSSHRRCVGGFPGDYWKGLRHDLGWGDMRVAAQAAVA